MVPAPRYRTRTRESGGSRAAILPIAEATGAPGADAVRTTDLGVTGRSLLLLLFFFASGLAALAYEVVWIRLLTLTLSVTVYSLTTVLCAFMAGLALGAAVATRVADRVRLPLVGFGVAELGIGICGLLVPTVLFHLGPGYVWLHDALGGAGAAFTGARFLLAFAVLLLPTTLMGVTLPLLSRAVIEHRGAVGRGAGALYAANTLGAVVGCVAAGFALIPALGLQATCTLAAALNFTIGALAVALGRGMPVEPSAPAERAPAVRLPGPVKLAAAAFGISGFTAMGYEVLWTRALEHFTHNSVYAYSAMLATFLLGLGAGSALMARRADRIGRPLLALGLLQVLIAISVVGSLLIFTRFETLIPAVAEGIGGLTSWPRVVGLIFLEASLTMLATTLLLGAMFPLVARVAVDAIEVVGTRIGMAYLANTIGSIFGSLLVGFLVLPLLGVRGAFVALVAANGALGLWLALASASRGRWAVGAAAVAAVAAAFALLPEHLFEEQFIKRFGKLLFYREEVTDTVMVTEAEDGERVIRYADGRGTAGTRTFIGDRMYGHLPLLLHPDPREILQITFGVGNSLSSVLQHPVESVVCVELSPGVIDAAPFFRATNRDALEDPRVELIINDGRNYLLTSHDRYDVIRLDPPELHTAGIVNLYTREFFQMARDHLAEGGIFSIWFNNVMTPEDGIRMLLRTALAVFPHVSVWHDPYMYSWIINGSVEPHAPDLARLEAKFALRSVREDLASIGIHDPYEFLAHFVFSGRRLEEYAGEGPIVIDDHTRLDFSVPRSEDSYFGIANYNTNRWLIQLMEPGAKHNVAFVRFGRKVRQLAAYKEPVLPYLVNAAANGADREELERRLAAGRASLPVR